MKTFNQILRENNSQYIAYRGWGWDPDKKQYELEMNVIPKKNFDFGKREREDTGDSMTGCFWSSSAKVASTYGNYLMKATLLMQNPYIIDFKGKNWTDYFEDNGKFYYTIDIEYELWLELDGEISHEKSLHNFDEPLYNIYGCNLEEDIFNKKELVEYKKLIKKYGYKYKTEENANIVFDFVIPKIKQYNNQWFTKTGRSDDTRKVKYQIIKEPKIIKKSDGKTKSTDDLVIQAKKNKYDSCIIKNVIDMANDGKYGKEKIIADTYTIFSPNQILHYETFYTTDNYDNKNLFETIYRKHRENI